jgi:hypothetical protein
MIEKPITKYCEKHGISIRQLSKMDGFPLSYVYLLKLNAGEKTDMRVGTALKLYNYTKENFGDGLSVWDIFDYKYKL